MKMIRVLWCVLFYVVLCNIPLWLASRWLGVAVQGIFGLEFLTIGALSLFAGWGWLNWLLPVFIAGDILCCIERTYMMNLRDTVQSVSSLPFYAESHVYSLAAIVGTMLVVPVAAVVLEKEMDSSQRKWAGWALVTTGVFCLLADGINGRIQALHPERIRGDSTASQSGRLIRNFVHKILEEEIAVGVIEANEKRYIGHNRIEGASSHLAGAKFNEGPFLVDAGRPNLVFVLVESWGKPLDSSFNNALNAPYRNEELQRNYTVSTGTVPFHGPTVAGELRELCGTTMAFGVITAPASKFTDCLPRRLDGMGYHTMAVHGFVGPMFSRDHWYSKVGFEETHFLRDFQQDKMEECLGPLPGACDADVAQWIGDKLQKADETPQFIYWVTLNSHLPVPIPNAVKTPPTCSGNVVLADGAICSWYQLIFNVHRSIAELAVKKMIRPTVFVVVGDHAPPFASQNRRNQFSNTDVPYVILSPKTESNKGPQPPRSIATTHPFYRNRRPSSKRNKAPLRVGISGD